MSLRPGMGKAKYSCPSRECSELIPCWITSPGKAFSLSRERGMWILECVDLSVELRTTRNLSSLGSCVPVLQEEWLVVQRALPMPSPGQGTWHVPLVMPWFCAIVCAWQLLTETPPCSLTDAATWTKTLSDNFESNQ